MLRLLSICLGLVFAFQVYSFENAGVGQPSEERPATAEVKAMVAGIKEQIESSLALTQASGSNGSTGSLRISARSFRVQLVNGLNYFVRVKVTAGKSKPLYYHIKVYKSFGGNVELVRMTGPKHRNDSIEYF